MRSLSYSFGTLINQMIFNFLMIIICQKILDINAASEFLGLYITAQLIYLFSDFGFNSNLPIFMKKFTNGSKSEFQNFVFLGAIIYTFFLLLYIAIFSTERSFWPVYLMLISQYLIRSQQNFYRSEGKFKKEFLDQVPPLGILIALTVWLYLFPVREPSSTFLPLLILVAVLITHGSFWESLVHKFDKHSITAAKTLLRKETIVYVAPFIFYGILSYLNANLGLLYLANFKNIGEVETVFFITLLRFVLPITSISFAFQRTAVTRFSKENSDTSLLFLSQLKLYFFGSIASVIFVPSILFLFPFFGLVSVRLDFNVLFLLILAVASRFGGALNAFFIVSDRQHLASFLSLCVLIFGLLVLFIIQPDNLRLFILSFTITNLFSLFLFPTCLFILVGRPVFKVLPFVFFLGILAALSFSLD